MGRERACIFQVIFCLMGISACLITYLEKQNELTRLRLVVPRLVQEIKLIQEDTVLLKYQIQKFESPERLMELACSPQYSHLKYPLSKEILVVQEDLQVGGGKALKHSFAVGAQ